MALYTGKETLLEYVNDGIPDGYHTLRTEANQEIVDIDVEVVNSYATSLTESGVNLIPVMTSATAPSGIVRSSTFYAANYEAYRAFDKTLASGFCWATPQNTLTGWLDYEFPTPRRVTAYSLTGQLSNPARSPKTWTFLGSDDGITWDTLDTQTNITGWVSATYKTFTFKNTKAYKRYRINVTANSGDTLYLCIGELNFYDAFGDAVPDQRMLILKFHNDLTISSDSLLTPLIPKRGMLLFVNGVLTNNGTISMTARGAKAPGQNVYMFNDINNNLCFIPSEGAALKTQANQGTEVSAHTSAAAGNGGTGRQTGGGGPGAGRANAGGTGAAGTSYSGGSGGGGSNVVKGGDGAANGGAGGFGNSSSSFSHSAGGGAGNPGGVGDMGNRSDGFSGANGTGGLLIIYSRDIINEGTISSNGSAGGNGYRAGGGGSGGGHVEIATAIAPTKIGTVQVTGGTRGAGTRGAEAGDGGTGGDGTLTTAITLLINDKQYLFEDNGNIKTYDNALGWITIGQAPVTSEMFEQAVNNITTISDARLQELASDTLKVIMLHKGEAPESQSLVATATPQNQLMLANDMNISMVKNIDSMNLTSTDNVKVIVSTDNGATWMTYQNQAWTPIEPIAEIVKVSGITRSELSTINEVAWRSLLSENPYKIRFGYYIAENENTDEISIIFDMQGQWEEALEGVSYTAEMLNDRIKVKLIENGTFKINY